MTIEDTQLTRADLREMSAPEIDEARRAGRLASLLGQPQPESTSDGGNAADAADAARPRAPKPSPGQGANGGKHPDHTTHRITDAGQLRHMSAAEINQARRDGRLERLGY
jgi:hypothetical protein